MAVSGAWKSSDRYQGYVDERPARLNWGTGVDPDHNRSDEPDLGFPALAPPLQAWTTPAFLEDMFSPERAEPPYFPPTDREPAGHDVASVPRIYISDEQAQARNNAARSVALGADNTATDYAMRGADEEFISERSQSLPPARGEGQVTGAALRALRGRNSLEINNPGSPEVNGSGNYTRQGWELSRWHHRRMPMRTLTHTKRELHLNTADTALEPAGIDGSPYSSPFRSVANLAVGAQRPYVRREPRPWDESAVVDGSEDAGSGIDEFSSWGL